MVYADLKAQLEGDDDCIEEIMAVLKEDRVMRLTEPEVYQVRLCDRARSSGNGCSHVKATG